jgi:protein TonB
MPGAAEDCGNPRGTETALPEPLPALPAQDSNRPRLLEEAATARAHPEPETRSAPIEAPIASTAPREKPPHLEKKPAHVPPAGPAGSAAAGRAGVPGDLEAARGAPGGPRERYLAALLRRLQAEKRYPPDARRKNWEGEAEVGIALGADGSLLDVRLEKSSHHAVLDEEATALILRAAPFPPLPRELGLDKWRLVIPIRFRIENRK